MTINSMNFHAREFAWALDELTGDALFDDGVRIGTGQGKISVKFDRQFHKVLQFSFTPSNPDHHILNIAYLMAKNDPSHPVIIVSKEVNVRIKAKSLGLQSQDFRNDHVKDLSVLYKGSRIVEGVDEEIISA